MKRKIFICLLMCLGLILVGCNKQTSDTSTKEMSYIKEFEKELKKEDIGFEKISDKNPQDGVKNLYYYYLDDNSVLELYVFDTQSELYKFAEKNGYIENKEIASKIYLTINKGLGITFDNDTDYRNVILEIFNNLK